MLIKSAATCYNVQKRTLLYCQRITERGNADAVPGAGLPWYKSTVAPLTVLCLSLFIFHLYVIGAFCKGQATLHDK